MMNTKHTGTIHAPFYSLRDDPSISIGGTNASRMDCAKQGNMGRRMLGFWRRQNITVSGYNIA